MGERRLSGPRALQPVQAGAAQDPQSGRETRRRVAGWIHMGTGDLVSEAIEELGVAPHLLADSELTTGDLSAWNVIVIGIRAYSNRPALTAAQPRLDEFVRNGGTLIVQYQSGNFPAPFPLGMNNR